MVAIQTVWQLANDMEKFSVKWAIHWKWIRFTCVCEDMKQGFLCLLPFEFLLFRISCNNNTKQPRSKESVCQSIKIKCKHYGLYTYIYIFYVLKHVSNQNYTDLELFAIQCHLIDSSVWGGDHWIAWLNGINAFVKLCLRTTVWK